MRTRDSDSSLLLLSLKKQFRLNEIFRTMMLFVYFSIMSLSLFKQGGPFIYMTGLHTGSTDKNLTKGHFGSQYCVLKELSKSLKVENVDLYLESSINKREDEE